LQWGIPIIVVVMTVAAFYPALQNKFVNWDDYKNIVENPHYRGLGWATIRWMFTSFHMGHYQPLTWVTLGMDYVLWGMNPFGYHLTSLILHAATAVAFFFLRESYCPLPPAARKNHWRFGWVQRFRLWCSPCILFGWNRLLGRLSAEMCFPGCFTR
jgi:hypothetical protein